MYLLLRVSRMGTYFLELIAWLMVSLESKTFSSWKNELLIFCNKQILLRVERAWSGGRNIYYSEIYKYPYVHSKKSFLSTKSTVKTLKTDHVLPSDVEVAWNIHKMILLYKYICIFECMSSIGQTCTPCGRSVVASTLTHDLLLHVILSCLSCLSIPFIHSDFNVHCHLYWD